MVKITKKKGVWILLFIPLALFLFGVISYAFGNVTVNYYDQIQSDNNSSASSLIGPCKANKLSDSKVTFVFTEPFPSLVDFEKASIKREVVAVNGTANTSLAPGKYGLYLKLEDGTKRPYSGLALENPSNTIPRDNQGPWYVLVNPFKNTIDFRESNAC